jgi:hypothetical protein
LFTYNENRALFVENGVLIFPNKVVIRVEFNPNAALGDSVPGFTCPDGSRVKNTWDANTGRAMAEADPPLPNADAASSLDGIDLRIIGRSLKATFTCDSRERLIGVLGALHFVTPVSLSLEFVDRVVSVRTTGRVGEARFVWQVQQTSVAIDVITQTIRNDRCAQAIEKLPVLCDTNNRRLLAACVYFQRAVRLVAVGVGPSEFASEAVLNIAKALEVLFPGPKPREAVREGLKRIGYESTDIERKFIPILLLRAKLDTAHVRMATLQADERRKLQIYMEGAIRESRKMIKKVFDAVASNELRLTEYRDERKPGDEISKILDSIEERSSSAKT